MERDLETQLEALLERMCSEHHVTEAGRTMLKRWFVETLETERRGWKGRLKDAVRAVDNEHRLTLAAHTTIQQVIALMVNRLPASAIASVLPNGIGSVNGGDVGHVDGSSADDSDKKANRLVQLEQFWTAATKYLDHLEQERTECLRVLGLDDAEDIDLKAEIEGRLGDMDKESSRKTAFQQLTSENGELRDRLRSVVRSARITKERYEKEQAEMKILMTTLEQRVLIQSELIDRLSGRVVRQDQAVQTDQIVRRVPPSRQQQQQAGSHPLASTASTFNGNLITSAASTPVASNTALEHPQRPQSSISGLLPAINSDVNGMVAKSVVRNSDEFYRKYALQQQQRQLTNSPTAFPPVTSGLTHNEVPVSAGPASSGMMQVVKPTQSQATAVVLPNIIFATTNSGMPSTNDVMPATASESSWTPYSPNYLRGQVINFASKLEETKREMDACQRELIRLKVAAFGATPSNYVSKDAKKRQRQQKQILAAKSVTTLHLPPVSDQLATARSLHGNETSRETQSTWRMSDGDGDNHYSMYARRPKNINVRHWRA